MRIRILLFSRMKSTWPTLIIPMLAAGRIDLSSCTGLDTLVLTLTPQFSIDTHSGFVTELLASWKPRHSEPDLIFCAYREQNFTRRGFADAVRALGTITEAWLQTVDEPPPGAGESGNCSQMKYRLRVEIVDCEAQKEWWSDHLESCFPTWLKLGQLGWAFYTREWSTPSNACGGTDLNLNS